MYILNFTFIVLGYGIYKYTEMPTVHVHIFFLYTHHLDRGLMISGWSQIKVGLIQFTSM